MHAMARAFPRQVCTTSVPHHKGGGKKAWQRADLRKKKKSMTTSHPLHKKMEKTRNLPLFLL
jgi:hypothetical protein